MSAVEEFSYRGWRVAYADLAIELARRYSRETQGLEAAVLAHHELREASRLYRMAGLSFLANRVDFFAHRVATYGDRTDFRDLWEKFDRLNADTTSVEEGGAA
jgi:hypothetical protein